MTKFNSNFIKNLGFTKAINIWIFIVLIIFTFFYPQKIYAATLYDIAKEFINKVTPVYSGDEKEEKSFNPIDQIPEGGTLLLRPTSQKFEFADEIYAVKSNDAIYLSLFDFINILNFAIDYNADTESGEGWFLREDWEVDFDLNQGYILSRGERYTVSKEDVYSQDGMTFVRSDQLAEWFGLVFDFDIQQQIINIESPFPFPAFAKYERDQNYRGRTNRVLREAVLPRLEQPKSNFDINTVDVSLGNRLQRNAAGEVNSTETASVYAQGEFLKHNGYIFASGSDDDPLRTVRGQLLKRSENADLLGPLKARSYRIGDVNEVRIPLVSGATQNLGFRFTNTTLDNTDFATTDIEGRAFPGWDVQLYRNGILIENQTVDTDGRYVFEEIQLFAGSNDFELFFFGLQGEIRSKTVSLPVSRALLASQNNTYEVSMTLQDSQTYRNSNSNSEDENTPTLTAKYNKLIGDNHLAYLGFRTREIAGDRKFFLSTGSTSTLGETLVDTNFAVDEDGETSAQAIVRQNLLGWSTSLRGRIDSDGFQFRDVDDNTALELALNAQKQLFFGGFKSNVLVNALYRETVDNLKSQNYSIALSNAVFGTSVSNRLNYSDNELVDGATRERLDHILSLRKNFRKYFLSISSRYGITPDVELKSLSGQFNYRHSNNFSTDLTYTKQFSPDFDSIRLNANYLHDKFRLSPFLQYNSNEEIVGGVSLNFSMYDDPNSPYPSFTSRRLGDRGGVNAFVYHDKNGNRMFDDGDEPLEGTMVESVTSRRRAETDADGYATMYDLPVTRATDITLKDDTMPDPFMLPATEGNSIYPAEGTFYDMEFPVHMTGEIDGTVFYYNDDKTSKLPVGYHDLRLISLDNKTRKTMDIDVERDGYYVAYMIPPGDYLLVPNEKQNYGNTIPEIITIGYDGPIISDIDVQLLRDASYVPYEVAFFDVPARYEADEKYRRFLKVKKAGVSELSKALNSAIIEQNENLFTDLVEVNELDKDNGEYEYFVALTTTDLNDPSFLHNKCRDMQQNLIDCSVMINSVSYGNE